jgi:hypothetical protein
MAFVCYCLFLSKNGAQYPHYFEIMILYKTKRGVQMKTAQWDTGFFDPPSEFAVQDACDCDLIFRKNEHDYSPLLFCSKDLPKILSCVAREIHSLSREDSLMQRESMATRRESTGQLHDWYQSVLKDIYLDEPAVDVPAMDAICPDFRYESIGFCLPARIAYDVPSSGYDYVALTLPPLWQERIPSCLSASSVCTDSNPSLSDIGRQQKVCEFRYSKSSGRWYSRLRQAGREKRILRGSASPEDSYRILWELRRRDLT